MKSKSVFSIILLALSCTAATADNIIRTSAPIQFVEPNSSEKWIDYSPLVSEWTVSRDMYGCTSISPDAALYGPHSTVTQTFSGCSQDESRTIQNQQINESGDVIRPIGTATVETRTVASQTGTRQTQGTLLVENTRYAIAPAQSPGLGAGYYRQSAPGVYNFGSSMQKTSSGNQMFFAIIQYQGAYAISAAVSLNASMGTSGGKQDVSAISPFLRPYKGMRLLNSSNAILKEYVFKDEDSSLNYFRVSTSITPAEYTSAYNIMPQVTAIELFQ